VDVFFLKHVVVTDILSRNVLELSQLQILNSLRF